MGSWVDAHCATKIIVCANLLFLENELKIGVFTHQLRVGRVSSLMAVAVVSHWPALCLYTQKSSFVMTLARCELSMSITLAILVFVSVRCLQLRHSHSHMHHLYAQLDVQDTSHTSWRYQMQMQTSIKCLKRKCHEKLDASRVLQIVKCK